MRRKPGQLLPFERSICLAALDLNHEFYGYEMAKHLQEVADSRLLIAHGTLYRALSRLEEMGLMKSHWEDPRIPARENRPGRRLYVLTALGESAARDDAKQIPATATKRGRRRWAPA